MVVHRTDEPLLGYNHGNALSQVTALRRRTMHEEEHLREGAEQHQHSPEAHAARQVEAAVRSILESVGDDPERDGLKNTPARVARMY
ncbi:MAG TPA: GTP cyclohydrolase I, partial [Burkholderiales bacterium]|nr:GTP cyclohydrolase I [Burkholderiales bacterium]